MWPCRAENNPVIIVLLELGHTLRVRETTVPPLLLVVRSGKAEGGHMSTLYFMVIWLPHNSLGHLPGSSIKVDKFVSKTWPGSLGYY